MHFLFNLAFLLAAWKWGDWRHWRQYYPTILFFIGGDLLYNFLLFDHHLWTYSEHFFGEALLQNHTFINLMIMGIVYPATIFLYLGRFPDSFPKKLYWIIFWVFLYSSIESINVYVLDILHYDNGWTGWWSLLFNLIMFVMLRIHFRNPLLAWGLSLIWIFILWNVFDVPIKKLR